LVDLILLPETSVFVRYSTVPISPPFDIASPRPEATIPIGQVQRSVLKRHSTGFKVNHLGGISITHWPKEGEPRLIIDGNGKMRPKFLERQMNLSFTAEKDGNIQRKIRSERLRKYRRTKEKDAFGETAAEPEPPTELEDAIRQKLWRLGFVA
jgi:hypothetical protein